VSSTKLQKPSPPPSPTATALTTFTRWVRGLLPPEEGGLPPILLAARAQLSGWVVASIALVGGAALGFVVVVVSMALPNVPGAVLGLAIGALLGVSVTLTLASRHPFVRREGAIVLLLFPLLVLAAPFVLISAAITVLRKTAAVPGTPPAAPMDAAPAPAPEATAIVAARPRRVRRTRKPKRRAAD
jgi:hypothetical protein